MCARSWVSTDIARALHPPVRGVNTNLPSVRNHPSMNGGWGEPRTPIASEAKQFPFLGRGESLRRYASRNDRLIHLSFLLGQDDRLPRFPPGVIWEIPFAPFVKPLRRGEVHLNDHAPTGHNEPWKSREVLWNTVLRQPAGATVRWEFLRNFLDCVLIGNYRRSVSMRTGPIEEEGL